ncbi:Major facilitator superfamily domain general substrate transporter [Penicillium angulare]|uniref:Major facilitator superfamily domain general substrate transporter n=1 Tax=Penicillium angulare TaxID=116970 RepID=UPI00253FE530|nr:Major facilitator superfamily domain general substrate transporter [Penicillium angulare]KAJ5263560.1 Major facilitator superfamily domain general substrate transporter [Penicillium angulare]
MEPSTDPSLFEKRQEEQKPEDPINANIEKRVERGDDLHAEHASESESSSHDHSPKIERGGKRELREDECYESLGFCFPTWRKWMILTVIFVVQMSMNFNSGVYSNALTGLVEEFKISEQAARVGQAVFLVAYAFGCELWAPWSEEFGRWPIMQLSLFFVNIWQIPCALAPNYGTIVVCRILGGLSSAGGSVTLGMTADMWEADDQGFAVAYVVLSSVGGSTIGPFIGGIIEQYLSWPWVFWVQLIFGGATQALHFFLVPETRSSILVDREAKRRRKAGEEEVYGPDEMKESRMNVKEVFKIWSRPFEMFLREPIVLFLSLLSGFSDALIFVFTESFSLVFEQWNMSTLAVGMTFGSILLGYIIAYIIFLPDVYRQIQTRRKHGVASRYAERRLLLLLFIAPLEPIGLLGFAWTSMGPPIPWIAPLIFACLIAMANYAIYMATIDYMIAAYGPYSASATGGNGFARDFLAGIATMYSTPMYENMGSKYHLQWASTLLGCVGFLVLIPIYVFYWKGPEIRKKSKFAQELAADREKGAERRRSRATPAATPAAHAHEAAQEYFA